jgi:transposase
MIPERMFHQILMLGEGWAVERVEYQEAAQQVRIAVRETAALWAKAVCPHCQRAEVSGYDHVPERQWRHLPVCHLQTWIACALPRGRCRQCQAVFQVPAPWEGRSKHFTQEFEGFALTLMREMPVSKAGEILSVTDQRLWRMLLAHVEAAHTQLSMEEVIWIGADEMSGRKGHEYLTVFADLVKRRVLYATEGKDAATWERFAAELLKHNGHPKAVTQAAIDMSPAYVKGVRENFANAEMVFDKFHVIQTANEGVEAVRRLETAQASWARGQLAGSQWIFRKNPGRHTAGETERLAAMDWRRLRTVVAYQMRLILQDIYKGAEVAGAREEFLLWVRWVKETARRRGGELLAPMVKVAAMVEKHLAGILGHWKAGLTTAFLEGLNSLFSATKRKARGYRTTRHLIAMLYFVAGKLRIPCY